MFSCLLLTTHLRRVRAPLEDGKKLPSPSDSPGLLYANEQYNRDNPLLGYLKNQYLVFVRPPLQLITSSLTTYQGARAILLGPTAARVRGASQAKKSGVAYSHSIRTINFPFIAYVACLVRRPSIYTPPTNGLPASFCLLEPGHVLGRWHEHGLAVCGVLPQHPRSHRVHERRRKGGSSEVVEPVSTSLLTCMSVY